MNFQTPLHCQLAEGRYRHHVGRGQKTAVLVPVKPFAQAKQRLAPVYSPSEREAISRSMLRTVVDSAQGLRVALVGPASAGDVRRFALINGARFLAEPDGATLDMAVSHGVAQLANLGYERVAVVHSDLPLARDITWLANSEGVIVVPDRTGKGTNAISVPSESGFRFSYGNGSFHRHCDEARRLGYEPQVVVDLNGISQDVDEPEDLERTPVETTSAETEVATN
jgi:2-phospho-L-lactate guanylyltransferase